VGITPGRVRSDQAAQRDDQEYSIVLGELSIPLGFLVNLGFELNHLLSWALPLGEFDVIKLSNVTTNTAVQEYSIDSGELFCSVGVFYRKSQRLLLGFELKHLLLGLHPWACLN
jgi:hypothetical protein